MENKHSRMLNCKILAMLQCTILACTLVCLKILVRQKKAAVRKRLIASEITPWGNLKPSELLLYIHLLPPRDQLCKYICSEADTFYTVISFPSAIYKRKYIWQISGTKSTFQPVLQRFFFCSDIIANSSTGQTAFTTSVQKSQRQINHVLMPAIRVSMGNADTLDRSSWTRLW